MGIFITGLPGCGKSTLIQKIAERLNSEGIKVSGFVTPELRKDNKRVGFRIINLATNEEGVFASIKEMKESKKFGKYFVNIKEFEEIGLKGIENGEVIIIDEIGKMELLSEKFRAILENLKNKKNLIASVHRSLANDFNAIDITNLSFSEREKLVNEIVEKVRKDLR
ncbi:MAG: NTPase [Candidatus Aenigmatarchaeota archaeon]